MFHVNTAFLLRKRIELLSLKNPATWRAVTLKLPEVFKAKTAPVMFFIANHARRSRMMMVMLSSALANHEILRTVIVLNAVQMMNNLARLKKSAKLLLHDNPVLQDRAVGHSERVVGSGNSNVSTPSFCFSSLVGARQVGVLSDKIISAFSAPFRSPCEWVFLKNWISTIHAFCKLAGVVDRFTGFVFVSHVNCRKDTYAV